MAVTDFIEFITFDDDLDLSLKEEIEGYHKLKYEKSAKCSKKFADKLNTSMEKIINILHNYDITDVETNGYWFHFCHNNYSISIVNQDSRLLLSYYKSGMLGVIRDYELTILEHENKSLYNKIINTYDYHDIIIDGSDVEQTMRQVLSMLP